MIQSLSRVFVGNPESFFFDVQLNLIKARKHRKHEGIKKIHWKTFFYLTHDESVSYRNLAERLDAFFFAPMLATDVVGGLMLSGCLSHSHEHSITGTPSGNFFIIGTDVR